MEEWIFKVEQFFVLDKTSEIAKINVIALHLDGCALHWHNIFLKNKEMGWNGMNIKKPSRFVSVH